MAWHLKDRELERKLVGLYPSFLDDLKFGVMNKGNRHYVHVECTRVRGNEDIPNDTVSLWYDELEEVPEYNRHDWNKFPAVKPPYNMMMRIEMYNGLGFAGFFKHFIEGDQWCYADGSPMPKAYSNNVKRYRPWCED